jgi:hypothetical protein
MGRIHSTAIAFASIPSVAALGSTLSAQYEEKGKPSPEPSAGMTHITVQLAANDHSSLGPEQKLSVTIP